jgi:hypothetical protein
MHLNNFFSPKTQIKLPKNYDNFDSLVCIKFSLGTNLWIIVTPFVSLLMGHNITIPSKTCEVPQMELKKT